MAKRRVKKRTHLGAKGGAPPGLNGSSKPADRTPKSMVIRIGAGEVGPSITQLVKDVRSMLEPETASRLKERKSNKLRDYTTMAGPLGVTHLLLFSRSEAGNTNLRLAITPRGPTLHFRVERYSLCKDVHRSMKRPKTVTAEYLTSPLLVMNNFMSKESDEDSKNKVPKHLESLTTTVFQSLFPPIAPQTTSLKTMKRVMLLDRIHPASNAETSEHPYVLQLRHYAISTPTAKSSVPRPLRRLDAATQAVHSHRRGLPNLGKMEDVSDYLLDPSAAGFTSGSESEADSDAEVEVMTANPRKVYTKEERQQIRDARAARASGANGEATIPKPNTRNRQRDQVEKKAIKLTELGPRLTLRLTKVEEGLCGGKVMWHEYIHKSKAEEKEQDQVWSQRNKEKEERRRQQKENVERKKKTKTRGQQGEDEDEDEEMDDIDDDDDVWDEEESDDELDDADGAE